MDGKFSVAVRKLAVLGGLLVSGCAGYGGGNLSPGVSTLPEVIAAMGQPAMTWKNPDGSEQLAFPRGPTGTQTFMAYMGPDGKLQRIEKVLDAEHISRIRIGMSKAEVLRILGPSGAEWTQTFARKNEISWSWLYCNSSNNEEFIDVNFDATVGEVRSTAQRPHLVGPTGIQPFCSQ
jgi:hypothetical protein